MAKDKKASPQEDTKEKPVKLNMTFEEALNKALTTRVPPKTIKVSKLPKKKGE